MIRSKFTDITSQVNEFAKAMSEASLELRIVVVAWTHRHLSRLPPDQRAATLQAAQQINDQLDAGPTKQ